MTPSGRVIARKYDKKIRQISSMLEQQRIAKSKACEYRIGGAILGFIVSLPYIWAVLQMFQIQDGGNFVIGYVIGIVVVIFVGYLSGFSQGLTQFSIACPSCHHKFILSPVGGHCPACTIELYIADREDCKRKEKLIF
ncbi:MAG: hypothetical protein MH252_16740 [Thermosynechococcaceae cyanobacterium MS004]|nr:hypothetical protein [Thermosynechococcaceae cyanobacterium MS004]